MVKEKLFLTPSSGWLLIEVLEDDKSSGLILTNKTPPLKGKVLAISGDMVSEFGATIPCPCKVGDIISHTTIGFEEIDYKFKKYRLIPFVKVIGVWS